MARQSLPVIDIINPIKRDPFDDPKGEWTFDFKYDGFRGVLYKDGDKAWFRSKSGNEMNRFQVFASEVAKLLKAKRAILDGEIVIMDESERPIFSAMLRKGGELTYIAFDLLWMDDEDLRALSLKERRKRLSKIIPRRSRMIKPAFSKTEHGLTMYKFMCENDLEGLVAKRVDAPYNKRTKWYKIKNPDYSQAKGREKIFNRRRE